MSSIADTLDKFADAVGEPRPPRLEYVEKFVRKVDLSMFTPQEREWIREGEREIEAEERAKVRP